MKTSITLLTVLLLAPLAVLPAADLTFAGIFTDHAVLQRDEAAPVWGWAAPNEQVTVEFAGQRKSATADDAGKWLARLDPMPASAEGRELVVQSAIENRKSKITDVVVGDVWLCSGQSNIHFRMNRVENSRTEIAAAENLEKQFQNPPGIPSQSDFDRIRRVHSEHANELFENVLKSGKIAPLQGGFAHLWLNRDLAEGNRLLREARLAIIKQEGGTDTMTPAIAGSEFVKWQMRTWNRIYQLYNSRSRFHPGRLDKETQAMIEELFWLYVCDKSRFERSAPRYVMSIQGSENHEMMHYSNTLLALQALKDSPAYKDRKLPDGRGVAEHYAAWNEYYKLYCVERARHGLLVELFSGYGKYTMPELFNLHDFAEDPVLRLRMGKLLDLIWADWAIGQLNGVRGGGRLRIYQGDPKKPEGESNWGQDDIWRQMSQFFLDSGTWWKKPRGYHPNPIIGYPWVLATTQYRLPDVIMDLATDVEGRGEYTYVARRLAKQQRTEAKDVPVTFSPWHALDPEDPRMLSYDHCTPDYVMGSLIIDPTLPLVSSIDYQKGQPLQEEGYPNLTSQNRYHGIVFSTDVNARVVPQCEGLANGKTYGQQQAVQHKNVLLVQRHAQARQTGDMRVLFGKKDMKERLVERDGWLVLKEGNAWLGIKGFSRTKPDESCGHKWDNNVFLRMKDGNAPVAFITGRAKDYPDIAAFAAYLKTFSGKPADGWFTLAGGAAEKVSLSLHLTCKALPKVNGTPVDLRPKMLFDSPFLRSEHGSGIVTIRKGPRELKIEMTDDRNVTRGAYPESTDLKD